MTANEAHYPGKMAPYRENGNDGKNVGGYVAQNEEPPASQFYNNTPKVTFSCESVGVYCFGTSTYCILYMSIRLR